MTLKDFPTNKDIERARNTYLNDLKAQGISHKNFSPYDFMVAYTVGIKEHKVRVKEAIDKIIPYHSFYNGYNTLLPVEIKEALEKELKL